MRGGSSPWLTADLTAKLRDGRNPARSRYTQTELLRHRMEQIAVQVQREPGRFSTEDRYLHPHKISGIERGAAWLSTKAEGIGTQADRWPAVPGGVAGINDGSGDGYTGGFA